VTIRDWLVGNDVAIAIGVFVLLLLFIAALAWFGFDKWSPEP
jgi:hypothetical protein